MTLEEFRAIDFRKAVAVNYNDNYYLVAGVNFEEMLFALSTDDSADPIWVRYENAELIK